MIGRWWNILRLRLRSLLARGAVERELAKELRFHLETEIEAARAKGLSLENAQSAARKKLGGIARIEEECRDMRRTAMFETILQDLKYALRTLLNAPGFTAILILTLTLSIGATTAMRIPSWRPPLRFCPSRWAGWARASTFFGAAIVRSAR